MSKKIDGPLFRAMVMEGALAIYDQRERANELNVFPVPDGDTGTNMAMTMEAAMEEMQKLESPHLTKAADTAAAALLRSARGNSGVILSLLFRGIAKKLHGLDEADGMTFATALREGVDAAYKAVMKPAEGTILTVSRVSAQHAVEACVQNPMLSVEEVLQLILTYGQTALAETQQQNPTLAKAGVVDAGAFGLLAILQGMQDAFLGISKEHTLRTTDTQKRADFSAISQEEITFTYCTEFIAERLDKSRNIARLRTILNEIGDSLVVVDDEELIKVHVHTDKPQDVLAEGLKFGALLSVKIENMRKQHTEKMVEGTLNTPKERVIASPEKKYGFVVVASGDGLHDVFVDLGADVIVQGGQTMNPSTNDILHAVDAVPAEVVFVLPNNKNIIMAAEQAASLSDKRVVVIPTKNIPQGISSMLMFDAEAEEGSNTTAMTEAIAGVSEGHITYAARDSDFDGKKIKQGEYISFCEKKLCANSKKVHDAAKKLAREMVTPDSAFATIIYGADINEEDARHVEELFQKENKNLEISLIYGGQPVYYYIISVE